MNDSNQKINLSPLPQPAAPQKILAINASPRGRKGNTDQILQPFLTGVKEAGGAVETVYLQNRKINPCLGCFTCWSRTPGICVHKDDMPELLEKASQADIWVYAMPLYAYAAPAQMKAYMDRTHPLALPYMVKEGDQFVHPMRHPEAWPKKLVVISTCGFPERHHFSGLIESFQRLTSRPALQLSGMILCPGAEPLGQPQLRPMFQWYFDAARCAGHEIYEQGKITPGTQALLEQPLFDDMDAFAKMANAHWEQVLGCG